jgi:hypothetical protein
MQKSFKLWTPIRYAACVIVALWGFYLIFTEGIDFGGRILLLIAAIGVSSTMLFDAYNKYMTTK